MSTRADIRITARDDTASAFRRVNSSLEGLNQRTKAVTRGMDALKGAVGAIGLIQLGRAAVRTGLQLERMETALRSVLGSQDAANKSMSFLKDNADRLGVSLLETSKGFTQLTAATKGTALEGEETRRIFVGVTEASRALGLTADDTGGILRAFTQIVSKGRVQAEELRGQIGERLPGAFQLAADAMGVTTQQLGKMMELGQVTAEDLLPKLADALTNRYGKAAREASQGAAANFERFKNVLVELAGVVSAVLIPPLVAVTKLIKGIWDVAKVVFKPLTFTIEKIGDAWKIVTQETTEATKVAKEYGEMVGAVSRRAELRLEKFRLTQGLEEATEQLNEFRVKYEQATENLPQTFDEMAHAVNQFNKGFDGMDSSAGEEMKRLKERIAALAARLVEASAELRNLPGKFQEAEVKTEAWQKALEKTGGAMSDMQLGTANARLKEFAREAENAGNKTESFFEKLSLADTLPSFGELTKEWDDFYSQLEGRYKASLSDVLDLWEKLRDSVPGVGESAVTSIDKANRSLFDMDEALKQVQNNIQTGFSDLFYDVFQGKGIDSVKDFAKRVKDIFLRLIADIAAAWTASKIFNLPINLGGFGGLINGGGIGGAIGQGTGIGGSIASSGIGKAVSEGLAKIGASIKGIFAGSGSAGLFGGAATPATMVGGGGSSLAGLAGLAIPAAIFGGTLLGTSALASSDAKEVAKYTSRYQSNFGQMAPQGLGQGGSFLGAFENGKGAVDEMYIAVSEQLNKALEQTGLIVRSLNLQFEESGDPVRRLIGDVDAVKTALSGAKVRGFEFAGSLETAIEKGNGLRVSIEGDADVIKQKLAEATAAGVGGFRDLKETGQGVSALLTGDIAQWNRILQEFVNGAVMAAVGGVNALGGAAASATSKFMDLAGAASSVSISGGRAAQVDPYRNLPKFADGGITRGPSIAGEAGPELIVPIKGGRVQARVEGGGMDDGRIVNAIERQTREIRRQARARDYRLG